MTPLGALRVPCPSNTCSFFRSGPGGNEARRKQEGWSKAAGCSGGIWAELTAPPPNHLVPWPWLERSGMQAVAWEAWSLPTPSTLGNCLGSKLANG